MNNDKNFNEMIDFIENSNKINKVKKKKTSKFVLLIINLLSITLLISGGIGLKIIYDKKLDYKKTEEMEQELADIYNRNSNVEPNQNGNNDLVEAPEEVPKEEYTESFNELLESIKDNVLLEPLLVSLNEYGRYELISGHRRKLALELLGYKEADCYVEELTDDEATIKMVDSNIYRNMILPSEKAFAYKMKLEAIKHQGKKKQLRHKLCQS